MFSASAVAHGGVFADFPTGSLRVLRSGRTSQLAEAWLAQGFRVYGLGFRVEGLQFTGLGFKGLGLIIPIHCNVRLLSVLASRLRG